MRLILFLSLLISACSSMKMTENKPVETKEEGSEGKIVFLVFKITNDSANDKRSVSFINQIESEGFFKEKPNKITVFPNQLIVEISEQNQVVEMLHIEHPLYQKTEYTQGNEWKSKLSILQEAEFYFRFQKGKKETVIRIYEVLNGKEKTEIYTLKI